MQNRNQSAQGLWTIRHKGATVKKAIITVRLFEDAGILERHDFRDGRSRYEQVSKDHHDHLIDMESGTVIEFSNDQIEKLQELVAAELGYKLVDHRLELYCISLESAKDEKQQLLEARVC